MAKGSFTLGSVLCPLLGLGIGAVSLAILVIVVEIRDNTSELQNNLEITAVGGPEFPYHNISVFDAPVQLLTHPILQPASFEDFNQRK